MCSPGRRTRWERPAAHKPIQARLWKGRTRTFTGRVLHLQAAEPLLDAVGTTPGGGAGGKTVTAGPSVSYPDCLVGCSGTSQACCVSCIVCTGTRVPSEDCWACGRVGGCVEGRGPPIVQAGPAQWLCPPPTSWTGWEAEAASGPSLRACTLLRISVLEDRTHRL